MSDICPFVAYSGPRIEAKKD